ncbi:MAG TPA: hypothetical protein VGM57_17690 [Pseudolabrys sp.]
MRSDDAIAAGGRAIAQVMASKMRFTLIILSLGIVGILYSHGLTWASAMFSLLAAVILGAGYIAFSFWIWFFRNLGQSPDRSKEQQ